jgi:hypothetical protein
MNNANAQSSGIVNESTPIKTDQSSVDSNNVNITMSKGPCHGICSVYYLEIDGDGHVLYRGYEHVNVTGEHRSSIPPEKVKELINQFNNSSYFELKDR